MMDVARLIEKLRLIEALFAGATTDGERVAADRARERILERLRAVAREDPPVEYRFTLGDMWSRRVFLALLRRYDLRPYRYPRQRRTTVMVRVSERFVNETLWPQYERLSETLQQYLSAVTDRVVAQVLSEDVSEAVVLEEPQALPPARASDPLPGGAPPAGPTPGAEDRNAASAEVGDTGAASRKKRRGRNRRKRRRKRGR